MRSSALIYMLAATVLTCVSAGAQDAQSPGRPMNQPMQLAGRQDSDQRGTVGLAPIGHRQPTAKDVPSSEDDPIKRSPEDEALEKKLKICRNC
jgi:hypothetical protein